MTSSLEALEFMQLLEKTSFYVSFVSVECSKGTSAFGVLVCGSADGKLHPKIINGLVF